jgi:anti-sigma B factor antagonist
MGVEFGLEVTQDGDTAVLWLSGDVDLKNRDRIVDTATTQFGLVRTVVADLEKVTFIDSSGLGALVEARQTAGRSGSEFVIRGATGAVARVLDMTRPDTRPHPMT